MHKITFLILLMIHSGIFAQNVKRGFRLLEKLDYEKAEEIFQEALVSDESIPAAGLGLAIIYADEQSPFYDLVESWSYVKILESSIDNLTQEEIDFIGEYFINTEVRRTSRPVKTKIEYAIAAIEAKLIKYIREENNLDIVYAVIERFPDFRHYDNVIHIRNQLEFRKYEKLHTIEGYRRFIKEFPDAAQCGKAQRYISTLTFEKARKENTVEAYRDFISEFPESPEYNAAIRNINAVAFQQAKKANTMLAMEEYIMEYPDALEVAEAKQIQKQLLYDYAKKIQTLEAYNEFIRKYPEGQQYIDIFNLKSLDLGMQFMEANPVNSGNIQWVRSFEKEDYNGLSACVSIDEENAYIIGGTVKQINQGYHDIWMIKTNSDGKMLWNKSIGEHPNQDLRLMTTNQAGEIIGYGCTWMENDSVIYNPRIFKLASDGKKLWSKTFDELQVQSILALKSGSMILGGYEISDSLGSYYSIMLLNPSGKKMWSRDYSVPGQIHGLFEVADNQILLAGTHWLAEIDNMGYIRWESNMVLNDSITAATVLPSDDIVYTGIRNNRLFVIKTDRNNNKQFEKEFEVDGQLMAITHLISGSNGQLAGICADDNSSVIHWINNTTGTVEKTMTLPGSFKVTGMLPDKQGNILLVAANGQILLLKNLGFTF